ncbi:MAG: metallophosphoesterase family protein [Pseudomonadota bacterium]
MSKYRILPGSALGRRTGRHLWRDMVHWFDPRLLLRTLFTLIVARLFAAYADRRERDGAQPLDGPYRYDDRDELWLDYVADLGDGWDSTATIAGLLAADTLDPDGQGALPHGRVLLMGGDQAYPVASREEYLARLEAPYYSLHPYSPEDSPRDLYVLPGNHDWYDGLAAFSRLFQQQRWFAGWRTRQSRSYFALRLPQHWWLLAVDVQLDNDIDAAQLAYLRHATADLAPGDRVVLMGAVPFWLEDAGSMLRRNLAFLERTLIRDRGARVYVSLAGDLHHFTRYTADDGRHRITAGGGGAFLHGTAWQPEAVADDEVQWRRAQAWPSPDVSRLALWRLLAFPFYNPSFAVFLGAMLTLLLWGADSASHGLFFANATSGVPMTAMALFAAAPASPVFAAALLAWFAGFVAFADEPQLGPRALRRPLRNALGMTHALLQLLLGLAVVCWLLPSRLADPLSLVGSLLLLVFWLSLAGGLLFGAWVWLLFQLLGCHKSTAWSACRIRDWKHFLRLHVAADGTLTVHVIGVERVCRRWRERQPVVQGEALAEPADGVALAQRAFLIERISVRPHDATGHSPGERSMS